MSAMFQGLSIKPAIWYELLRDIQDEMFLVAIRKIVNDVKDVYPGTNMVAMIREACKQEKVPCLADACNQVWPHLFRKEKVHPLVEKCIKAAGGYHNFNENYDYAMRTFMRIYQDAKETQIDPLRISAEEHKTLSFKMLPDGLRKQVTDRLKGRGDKV